MNVTEASLQQKETIVLILNWQNPSDTIECLDSILKADDSCISKVLICDNGSKDTSIEEISVWLAKNTSGFEHFKFANQKDFLDTLNNPVNRDSSFADFIFIENGYNYGFAGGNNVGLQFIQENLLYDYVFLLNNDTVITSQTVSSIVNRMSCDNTIGMCGSKVIYFHTPDQIQALGGVSYNKIIGRSKLLGNNTSASTKVDCHEIESNLDYILGAALTISKSCLEEIGTMEDRYFLYYEEIDWATRAKRKGYKLAFAEESVVYHKEGATIGSSGNNETRSALSDYYMVKSRLMFTRKFYPLFYLTVYLFSFIKIQRILLAGNINKYKKVMRAFLGLDYKA